MCLSSCRNYLLTSSRTSSFQLWIPAASAQLATRSKVLIIPILLPLTLPDRVPTAMVADAARYDCFLRTHVVASWWLTTVMPSKDQAPRPLSSVFPTAYNVLRWNSLDASVVTILSGASRSELGDAVGYFSNRLSYQCTTLHRFFWVSY